MKLTIIGDDKAVYVDGVSYSNLALLTIPANVHALQWLGDNGWIEYKDAKNELIVELPAWADDAMASWNIAESERLAEQARQEQAAALSQAEQLAPAA